MINRQSSVSVAVLVASAALSACVQPVGEEQTPSLGQSSQAIIGGAPAPGAAYAAVGALVYYYPEIGVLDARFERAADVMAEHVVRGHRIGLLLGQRGEGGVEMDRRQPMGTAVLRDHRYDVVGLRSGAHDERRQRD